MAKQSKMSDFFKPQQHKFESPKNPIHLNHHNHFHTEKQGRSSIPDPSTDSGGGSLYESRNSGLDFPLKPTTTVSKILNKKRNYAQLHLDLGQSDFLLRTCSICGFKYACGDEGDESFHKDYTQGIQFKRWQNERVVLLPSTGAGRIILVLDNDPPAHRKKVQKVVEMMEMELCSGWLTHKLCKVYLFILHQRVVGCLVAEPIKEAYRVFSNSRTPQSPDATDDNRNQSTSVAQQFEDKKFQREPTPSFSGGDASAENVCGAIFLDKEAVRAACGIRAIWVAPARRRKHIATQLLDAARSSFSGSLPLERSQLAFSDLTSTGKVLASRYCATASFLAYKSDV